MKKLFTLFMSAVLALGLSVPSMAAEPTTTTTGTITVENPIKNQTYSVYRIFDLESYDAENGAYAYVLNDTFADFAKQNSIKDTYITLETKSGSTYVQWVDDADVKAFAKAAIEWAAANADTVKPIATKTAENTDTPSALVFSDLTLGYYLLDSSAGALCTLTTTNPTVTVKEKNSLATVKKEVKEGSTGDFGESNNAQIGEVIEFKSEITLGDGNENLVLHDLMDRALTLDTTSFKVMIGDEDVAADNYKVNTSPEDQDTFDITFLSSYTAGLAKGTVLKVLYKAELNDTAKIYKDSNDNSTHITFGDNLTSETSTTKTYTYAFDLIKTDQNGKIISGAEFYLYDKAEGGNIVPVVAVSENAATGEYVYRLAVSTDTLANDGKGDLIKAGHAVIKGLDNKAYYLNEETAPDGYNKLSARHEVDLTNGNLTTEEKIELQNGTVIGQLVTDATGGVQVINNSGKMLPSTGGIGTTIFYVAGGILILAAVALLAAKRYAGTRKRG